MFHERGCIRSFIPQLEILCWIYWWLLVACRALFRFASRRLGILARSFWDQTAMGEHSFCCQELRCLPFPLGRVPYSLGSKFCCIYSKNRDWSVSVLYANSSRVGHSYQETWQYGFQSVCYFVIILQIQVGCSC